MGGEGRSKISHPGIICKAQSCHVPHGMIERWLLSVPSTANNSRNCQVFLNTEFSDSYTLSGGQSAKAKQVHKHGKKQFVKRPLTLTMLHQDDGSTLVIKCHAICCST